MLIVTQITGPTRCSTEAINLCHCWDATEHQAQEYHHRIGISVRIASRQKHEVLQNLFFEQPALSASSSFHLPSLWTVSVSVSCQVFPIVVIKAFPTNCVSWISRNLTSFQEIINFSTICQCFWDNWSRLLDAAPRGFDHGVPEPLVGILSLIIYWWQGLSTIIEQVWHIHNESIVSINPSGEKKSIWEHSDLISHRWQICRIRLHQSPLTGILKHEVGSPVFWGFFWRGRWVETLRSTQTTTWNTPPVSHWPSVARSPWRGRNSLPSQSSHQPLSARRKWSTDLDAPFLHVFYIPMWKLAVPFRKPPSLCVWIASSCHKQFQSRLRQ